MTACLLSYVHRIKKKATREVGGEKGIIKGGGWTKKSIFYPSALYTYAKMS